MYDFYIDKTILPVAPESVSISCENMNNTYDLVNGGQINILKEEGLKTISFECLLPSHWYPFSTYKRGYQPPIHYLEIFDELKKSKKIFQLIINRRDGLTFSLFDTNLSVSLEEYTVNEEAEEGTDVKVSLTFKEYNLKPTKTLVQPNKDIVETPHSESGLNYINSTKNVGVADSNKAFVRRTRPITANVRGGTTDIPVDANLWRTVRRQWGNLKNLPYVASQNSINTYLQELPKVVHYAELQF